MLPEDQKRLERAASIARAKRGPDYSALEKSISNAKRDASDGEAAQNEFEKRKRYQLKLKRERGEDKLGY